MAGTRVERPAPRRAPSTPMRQPIRRPWACPRATTTRAGAQKTSRRSRARARRVPPTSSPELMRGAKPPARPTTLRARPQAARLPRPEDPTRAVRLRALPTTEAALQGKRRGPRARPPTKAQAAGVRLPVEEAEEEEARLRAAAEAARLPAAAEAARRPVGQAVAKHPAGPSPETALLPDAAHPRSMSECCLVRLPAARRGPTKARVGPSPTSVARPAWALRRAGPSLGWRTAAEGPGRRSTRSIPVAGWQRAEPRSARQAAAAPPGLPSLCAQVTRAGLRSCSSCPWSALGGP